MDPKVAGFGAAANRAEFAKESFTILGVVREVIMDGGNLEDSLGSLEDCVCLKSADKRLLYTNPACKRVLRVDSIAVGQLGESLMAPSTGRVSDLSDELILSGCTDLIFDHLGHDRDGLQLSMSTAKFSLLGLGHRSMAILGVTRIHRELGEESDQRVRAAMLSEKWGRFQAMDANDRQLAVRLVRGESIGKIAEDCSVSKRTVENRRARILKHLDVETPLELAKLLIKLQENGFGDLNL